MTSPTSRSLSDIPDVLYHVFSYLDPVHHSKYEYDQMHESRRSLALAARTCRGFTSPALDVLWKRLPDDQPLADLLCELGIATREEKENRERLELLGKEKPGRYQLPNQGGRGYVDRDAQKHFARQRRLLRGYDIRYHLREIGDPRKHPSWPRFVQYASRVRSVTLFAFDGPAWCGIWDELLSRTPRAPILPNVFSIAFCRISWWALTPGALALILLSVRGLNFNLGDEFAWPALDENLRCLFSQSFTSAPEIDHLRLEFPLSHLGSPLLKIHCSSLRQLEVVPQVDFECLRILADLPALQHLSVSLSRENSPAGYSSFTFKSVTTFIVEGTRMNLCSLFDTIRLPSMHTLSVSGWEYGEPVTELAKAATRFFRMLATRQPSLPSLSIFGTQGRPPPSRGCVSYGIPLVPDTFEGSLLDLVHPLLGLSALRDLKLVFPSYFDIACTAVDLRAVAEAFPALETFHLDVWFYDSSSPWQLASERAPVPPPPECERPRGGPLGALVHFARNCPRLRVLYLPAMAEMVDSEGLLGVGVAHDAEPHGLRTLVVPKVLLPPGRADLVGEVSEVVRAAFPLVASVFRPERLVMDGNWAVVEGVQSWCPRPRARLSKADKLLRFA